MSQNERCTCEQCAKMKNPRHVHNERTTLEGFVCHFRIMRDGRTQNYVALLVVEVGDGRSLQTGATFNPPAGTKQQDAISAIIRSAVDDGVLNDLLGEATVLREEARIDAEEGVDVKALARKLEEDMTRMLQQDMAQTGRSPLDALRARMEAVAAQDPFRPVRPKVKTYLN